MNIALSRDYYHHLLLLPLLLLLLNSFESGGQWVQSLGPARRWWLDGERDPRRSRRKESKRRDDEEGKGSIKAKPLQEEEQIWIVKKGKEEEEEGAFEKTCFAWVLMSELRSSQLNMSADECSYFVVLLFLSGRLSWRCFVAQSLAAEIVDDHEEDDDDGRRGQVGTNGAVQRS